MNTSANIPALERSVYQTLKVGEFPSDLFDLVPQSAVRVSDFPFKSSHNSIWDFTSTPDGRMFTSLCNEYMSSASAQLYEYVPATGELKVSDVLNYEAERSYSFRVEARDNKGGRGSKHCCSDNITIDTLLD